MRCYCTISLAHFVIALTLALTCVRQSYAQLTDPKPVGTLKFEIRGKPLVLSPNGATLAVVNGDVIEFWDVATFARVGKTLEYSQLTDGQFSPDGSGFATTRNWGKEVSLWDTRSVGKCLQFAGEPKGEIKAFEIAPSGKTMLYSTGCKIIAAACATANTIHTITDSADRGCARCIRYFPDQKRFLTAGKDNRLRVWDANSYALISESEQQTDGEVRGRKEVSISPDGRLIATLSGVSQTKLHVWESETLRVLCSGFVDTNNSTYFNFIDDKRLSISDSAVVIYDVSEDEPRKLEVFGGAEHGHGGSVSATGDMVTHWVNGGRARALEALKPNQRIIATLPNTNKTILFSTDGKTMCVPRDDDNGLDVYSLPKLLKDVEVVEAEKRKAAAVAVAEKAATEKARQMKEAVAAAQAQKEQEIKIAVAANQQPAWQEAEDLCKQLASFGEPTNQNVRSFVEWGTPENAKRARNGDRFDREDAAAGAADHRKKLSERLFSVQTQATWDTRETPMDRPNAVRLRVPLFFKCYVSADQNRIGVGSYDASDPWYMTVEGKLARAPGGGKELPQLRARDAVVYFPERHEQCELLVTVDGDREFLKRVAREAKTHAVNLCFANLRMEPVSSDGYFLMNLLESRGFDSAGLMRLFNTGLNGKDGVPNYFVVKEYSGVDAERPAVPVAELKMCEVIGADPSKRDVLFSWGDPDTK